jgi:hypothetical protein
LSFAIPVNYQQQLDMVSFRVAGRLHHNEVVRNGAEKEWDLISLGESEWGGAYTLGMNRHKKNSLQKGCNEVLHLLQYGLS